MAGRFGALDVCAQVSNLVLGSAAPAPASLTSSTSSVSSIPTGVSSSILGLRVANVYDVNPKTYLFKLARPDRKEFLLMESGVRFHVTAYSRDKSHVPSPFAMKLRKFLRTKRLEKITQLGIDRIIDFTFGQGPATYHLILELYSNGNIVLTDFNYEIIAALRQHRFDDGTVLAPKEKYPLHFAREFESLSLDKVREKLNSTGDETLRHLMNKNFDFGPSVTEHILLKSGLAELKSPFTEEQVMKIYSAVQMGEGIFTWAKTESPPGFIVLKSDKPGMSKRQQKKQQQQQKPQNNQNQQNNKKKQNQTKDQQPATDESSASTDDNQAEEAKKQEPEQQPPQPTQPSSNEPTTEKKLPIQYDCVIPFRYAQFENEKVIEFPAFNDAVDEFYSKIEAQKHERAVLEQEQSVTKKMDKVKKDQQQRINSLEAAHLTNLTKASLIETNIDDVDRAIMIIRSAIASGIDWTELARIVKDEKKKGDPIAGMIHRLKLESNEITLLLNAQDQTEEEMTRPSDQVDIDISLSAYANARKYYEMKKTTEQKKNKTIGAVENALKAAEKKGRNAIKDIKVKSGIQQIRKPFWFEKFHWFISSDNYVVIAGRDAQQNELIVKRYLKKGDIYVHADLHGAPSCVVKNPDPLKPIPPSTLLQAGCLTVCRSAAWSSKVVTSAYWVYDNQVSKTAPTGEYLTTGSFMIRGRKNFLPPCPLVMAFSIMFRLDETSISKHLGERTKPQDKEDGALTESSGSVSLNSSVADLDAFENDATTTTEITPSGEEKSLKEGETSSEQTNITATEEGTQATTEAKESPAAETTSVVEPASTKSEDSEESEDEESPTPARVVGAEDPLANKYKLNYTMEEREQEEVEEEKEEANTKPESANQRKRLTAKERKLLKKGKPVEQKKDQSQKQEDDDDEDDDEEEEEKPQKPRPAQQKAQAKRTSTQAPRGKKGKLKKMKEKYADQDEEERELRMFLLGSKPKQTPAEEKGKKGEKAPAEPVKTGGRAKKEAKKEEREIKALIAEENLLGDEAIDNLSVIDSLTGVPFEDDTILFAIPVCAPVAAVNNYKYKVKFTPGPIKKGKAVKMAISAFSNNPTCTPREKELFKAIPDEELFLRMLGDVNLSLSHNVMKNKINKKQKKAKNKSNKKPSDE
eukprot:TRINITY_DN546_c0_g1_i1.p1 TRINITY_DN546_c0_g1~~TRINITY_DN546_c0_g1_i1.p1  ORF type:complete len:1148 (-),score=396.63 TRINITY_DN546_c0_g1_i1:62-3505(-)